MGILMAADAISTGTGSPRSAYSLMMADILDWDGASGAGPR